MGVSGQVGQRWGRLWPLLVLAACGDGDIGGPALLAEPGRDGAVSMAAAGAGPQLDGGPVAATTPDAATPTPLSPPALCFVTLACSQDIVDEPKRECEMRVQDGAGTSVYAGMAGVERRGRSSQAYDKPNYSLELRDATGLEQPTNLLGMGKESDWILDGSWVDRSFVRNDLAFDMFRSLQPGVHWAPRSRFCELELNGAPQGIYRLVERIKRDDDRIDLPPDDGAGSSFILKQDGEGALRWSVGEQARWKLVYPRQEDSTPAQRRGVQDFLDALDAALRDPASGQAGQDLLALLDLDAVVDFVLVQELMKSVDAYNLSLHLWKGPTGGAQLIPWDFDLSMGQPTADNRPDHHLPSQWVDHRTLLSDGLSALPAFRQRLVERWWLHRQGPLQEQTLLGHLDRYLQTLAPDALSANYLLWPLQDVDFRPIYGPYGLYPVSSHSEEMTRLRAWLAERLVWIDQNIDRYPE